MTALGIDVGTTSLKAVILASDRIVARATYGYPTERPQPGWAEQRPSAWWSAAADAIASLGPAVRHVSAVGVTGQGSTVVVSDADGVAITPAIGWQDQRARARAREAEEELAVPMRRAHGNRVADAPEPKLQWLAEHDPDLPRPGDVALTAAGWLTRRLGARPAISEGDAGSWLSFDRHTRAFDAELAVRLGVADLLPEVASLGTIVGLIGSRGAAIGLPAGTPIVATTSDVGAAAIAAARTSLGEVHYSKGTGGFITLSTTDLQSPSPLLALPLGDGAKVQLCAAIDTVGAAFDWARRLAGGLDVGTAEALAHNARGGLVVIPWLQGAQHPVLDPDVRGIAAGASLDTGPGELIRAVMEGCSLELASHLDLVHAVARHTAERLSMAGGPTASALWNRLDAAATRLPIDVYPQADAAVGAAACAGVAVGLWSSAAEGAEPARTGVTRYEPEPLLVENLARASEVTERLKGAARPALALLAALRDPVQGHRAV